MAQEFDRTAELDEITFDIDARSAPSSASLFVQSHAEPVSVEQSGVRAIVSEEMSPVFRALADPKLPELSREARARLLMQSPTRLYFYWSTGANPSEPLARALGDASGYRLALRLLDLTRGTEELHGVEREGSWWFDVRPNTEYRAEVGFYSPSRPFVRVLFSNTITTPRKEPSPHRASEARWMISAGRFADVLEASGFTSDAVEVAGTQETGQIADSLAQQIGVEAEAFAEFSITEMRQVLESLAAGTPIVDFKWKISAELYAMLEEHLARLSASSIRETLGLAGSEEVDQTMTAVGGSLVNIRRPRYRPISSHSSP